MDEAERERERERETGKICHNLQMVPIIICNIMVSHCNNNDNK